MAHHHCIDLRGSHRLPVLADMQPPSVDDVGNLFGAQTAVALCKDIEYGFLDSHQSMMTAVPEAVAISMPLSAPSVS